MENKFTFFWSGPFSQWSYSSFKDASNTYTCAEQYMMYQKAVLFNDYDAARKIMATTNPSDMKHYGRMVKGFDQKIWDENCERIVYAGNYLKYNQNEKHRLQLFETVGTILVEASPVDKIWGIGLNEIKANVIPPEQWPGKNLLGKILTKVRDDLLKEHK